MQYTVWQYSAGEDLEDRILENGLETFPLPRRKKLKVVRYPAWKIPMTREQ